MPLTIRFRHPNDEDWIGLASSFEREGVISFGDLRESFLSPTTYWTEADYELSWLANIHQVRSGGNGFLATEIDRPESAALFRVWPILWVGKTVHITEKLVLREQATSEFHPSNLMQLIDFTDLEQALPHISSWILDPADLALAAIGDEA